MAADYDADVEAMGIEDLLAYQQEMTRRRMAALDAGRRAQAEIDRRAEERARQRADEDAEFGAVRKPATQHVFGNDTEADPVLDVDPDETPTGVLRKADR